MKTLTRRAGGLCAFAFIFVALGTMSGCDDSPRPDESGVTIEAGSGSDQTKVNIDVPGVKLDINSSDEGVKVEGTVNDTAINVDGSTPETGNPPES